MFEPRLHLANLFAAGFPAQLTSPTRGMHHTQLSMAVIGTPSLSNADASRGIKLIYFEMGRFYWGETGK